MTKEILHKEIHLIASLHIAAIRKMRCQEFSASSALKQFVSLRSTTYIPDLFRISIPCFDRSHEGRGLSLMTKYKCYNHETIVFNRAKSTDTQKIIMSSSGLPDLGVAILD
jgi:hypothetical protein